MMVNITVLGWNKVNFSKCHYERAVTLSAVEVQAKKNLVLDFSLLFEMTIQYKYDKMIPSYAGMTKKHK